MPRRTKLATAARSSVRPAPLRLVLDTNVWLDWLVFADPGIGPLKAMVDAGAAEIFTTAACDVELARVLASPLRKATLDAAMQAQRLEAYRRTVRWLDGSSRKDVYRLPVCRDPDDQKFLELAGECDADYLVTRDRALLVLGQRRLQRLLFRIVTPMEFVELTLHTSAPNS